VRLGLVTEAFADRSLAELLDWLEREAPEITDLEIDSGGYAPQAHCDRRALLRDADARSRWRAQIEDRGLRVGALNAWGNPLHPDPAVAARHDADLRETIRLAAALEVDRVVAMAGCPAAVTGDSVPHFAGGGWLPYLEGVYEAQWRERALPYWTDVAAFAAAEHPELLICLELHPGTLVYNVETFGRLAAIASNLAANLDPSHFFWQRMEPRAVIEALGGRVGHAHAKDVVFDEANLARNGLLDHRWPHDPATLPWNFATVGDGHDAAWWGDFAGWLEAGRVGVLAIEHEDPLVPAEVGVPRAAKLLAGVLSAAGVARGDATPARGDPAPARQGRS
jgi:sugar phosphate isomerase/epimerase